MSSVTSPVLAGLSRNRVYQRATEKHRGARAFDAFDYLTPLNGGDGFTWRETAWLRILYDQDYGPRDDGYIMASSDVHTIQIVEPETILIIEQFADEVPIDKPTTAYRPLGRNTPFDLSGLYSRMTADHALKRVGHLAEHGLVVALES